MINYNATSQDVVNNWNLISDGWVLLQVEDLEWPRFTCEHCKKKKLRYVHHIQHNKTFHELKVGCICIQKLGIDNKESLTQEKNLKSNARSRTNAEKNWRETRNGNFTLKHRKKGSATVYRRSSGLWGFVYLSTHSSRSFANPNEAKNEVLKKMFPTMMHPTN